MSVREMTPGDIEAGLRLCRLSHWNQVARDWGRFLGADRPVATVAVDDAGQVIGSVAAMRYRAAAAGADARTVAWLAMVLVDPDARGRGIGTALLTRGLDAVADATTVGLDATPLGQPLYEKLGFVASAALTRMERDAGAPRPQAADAGVPGTPSVRRMERADADTVARLDARATGLDRSAMLEWLHDGAPDLAWIAEDDGTVAGFALGRRGHHAHHVGPVIAETRAAAHTLLQACVEQHHGQRLIVDIADADPGWLPDVEALGFRAQRPFTRMYRGDWRPQNDGSRLFAAIGPEFG